MTSRRSALALVAALVFVARGSSAYVCSSGLPVTNVAPTGSATASSNPGTAGNAIDGNTGTSWSAAFGTTSAVYTWEAPADVVVGQVELPSHTSSGSPSFGSVSVELLDASDVAIASGSAVVLEQDLGSGVIQYTPVFSAGNQTLRKIRLTLGAAPFPPIIAISEIEIWSPAPETPPSLPGPGPEELSSAATFQGLGDGAGGAFLSRASGISPDGRLVVGETETSPGLLEAFRFADGELTTLGASGSILVVTGPGAASCVSANQSHAFAAANTGHAVGNVCGGTTCGVTRFGGGGPEVYEPVVSGITSSNGNYASDLTADGAEITGMFDTQNPSLPQWGQQNLFSLLLPQYTVLGAYSIGGGVVTQPRISPEGDCIVATVNTGAGSPNQTASFGACGAKPTETATDVSAGGTHVVGSSGGLAARGGLVLGDLPGGAEASRALGVSDDANTVVGWGTSAAGQEALIWTPGSGIQRLADVLASQGVDLTGWTLVQATGVSASGRTIVGWGTNPSAQTEGFVATLAGPPTVPSLGPLGAALAGLLFAGIGARGLRRRERVRASGTGTQPRLSRSSIGV